MPYKKGFLSRAPFAVTFKQVVAAGSMLTSHALFANPSANNEEYEVLGIDAVWDVVSVSGTIDIRNVGAGAAMTAGATLLTGTISTAAAARAAAKSALVTSRVTRIIRKGNYLTLILAGTQTNLVGLNVTVWLQAIRGIRAR